MNSSFLAGNIDFQFSLKLSGEENIVYQATLKNANGEFRIYILRDNQNTNSSGLSIRRSHWNNTIPYFNFGEYLQTKSAQIDGKNVSLDLTKTRLITMIGEVSSSQESFYFLIDSYQYSYFHTNTEHKASFFLNNPSNGFVRGLGLIESDFTKLTPRTYHLNTPNFNCRLKPNLDKDACTTIIEYDKYNDPTEIIKENDLLLDIASFYYASPIEFYLTVIEDPDKITIKHQQPHYNLQKSFYRNMDLAYLTFNPEDRKFSDFLEAIKIETNSSNLLHVIISDYIRSHFLDETSRFLVLYAILETLAGNRDVTKFSDSENMKKCFEELYETFAKKISFTDEEKEMPADPQKPNGEKTETIRWKWDKLKEKLIERPVTNSIKQFLEKFNIDWEKMNKDIVWGSTKKIKHITILRNKLVHNRTNDYTHNLPMRLINDKMSFAVCIVLLNKLGITGIEFRENDSQLSIFKDA